MRQEIALLRLNINPVLWDILVELFYLAIFRVNFSNINVFVFVPPAGSLNANTVVKLHCIFVKPQSLKLYVTGKKPGLFHRFNRNFYTGKTEWECRIVLETKQFKEISIIL